MASLSCLDEKKTVFMLCDMQTRILKVIHGSEEIVRASKRLVLAASMLEVPILVTEQYPDRLGGTDEELPVENAFGIFPKVDFTMMVPEVEASLSSVCSGEVESVVLFGVESHVCVEATAIDLRKRGMNVHVVADATSSRRQEDRLLAFERMKQIGCFVTTHEAVLFKLLKSKNHPKFKEVQALILDLIPATGLV